MENYNDMKADALRDLAKQRQIPGGAGMKKEELIAALEIADQPAEDPTAAPDPGQALEVMADGATLPDAAALEKTAEADGIEKTAVDENGLTGTPAEDIAADLKAFDEAEAIRKKAAAIGKARTGEKIGKPIGAHRGPKELFARRAAEIDAELTDAEREAISALMAAGWLVMIDASIDSARIGSSARAHRIRGRYDLVISRKKRR